MQKFILLTLCAFVKLSGAMTIDVNQLLINAALKDDYELAKQALDNGANANARRHFDQATLLMLVSANGNAKIAKLLIERGADTHAQNDAGLTALMMASVSGQAEVVQLLLDHGAELNGANCRNETALSEASYYGRTKVVKLLLAAGAEVNYQNKYGWTALMAAFLKGEPEVVKLLLNAGADISLKNNNGDTAFMMAQQNDSPGNKEVMLLLQSVQEFLDHPIEQIIAHPENLNDYFCWSIAYKKDEAYKHLTRLNPEILINKNLVGYFLIAARVGNAYALNSLGALLKAHKPEGYKFVFLKALNVIMKLHPELSYLVHQVLAEDVAPAKVESLK